jgi:cytochrome c
MPPPSTVWVRTRKADNVRHKAMKLARPIWLQISIAVVVALVALLLVRLHNARGATPALESASAGHRLAEAWCTDCHSIEEATAGTQSSPPDFTAIANRASTTALSLKVFFQTSHRNMPNLIIAPAQADDLVNYILSLKRD